MRLLVDAHVFDEAPQGTRTYLKGLYTEIIRSSGTDLHIYLCAKNIESLQKEFGKQANTTYIKLHSANRFFRLIFELPWIIKRHKIDYAHFQYISPLIKTCKEIVTIHDLLFLDYPEYFPIHYRLYKSILFKMSARRADIKLTVSEFSRQSISKHFKIEIDRIYITPNAVESDFFEDADPDKIQSIRSKYKLRKYLLCVSRIEPRKNQVLLLRAYTELRLWKCGYDMVFIGRTDIEAKEFSSFLSGLEEEIKGHIKVLCDIPLSELRFFYQGCELFIYPSFAEGFGIPPLEAAASRCTVLCSNATAMRDFYFFNDSFFDPNNLDQLKEKILYYLERRDEKNVSATRDTVAMLFRWDTIANFFLERLRNR